MKNLVSNISYGRAPENPVLLNSVRLSLTYLNNLVTTEGLHIVYHRLGSSFEGDHPVDHYELLTADLKYDDIYISIYSENILLVPPEGYLFESASLFIIDYDDETEFFEIEDENLLYHDSGSTVIDEMIERNKLLPQLERMLFTSGGTNMHDQNFPYSTIRELTENQWGCALEKLNEVLDIIKPREKYDLRN